MDCTRASRWLLFAGLLLCLPGSVYAASVDSDDAVVYSTRLPQWNGSADIEISTGYFPASLALTAYRLSTANGIVRSVVPGMSGGWQVSISIDPSKCEISCSYRRVRDVYGRASLLSLLRPPMVAVRIYSRAALRPALVTVDPAGVGRPDVRSDKPDRFESAATTGQNVFNGRPPARFVYETPAFIRASRMAAMQPLTVKLSPIPLRI